MGHDQINEQVRTLRPSSERHNRYVKWRKTLYLFAVSTGFVLILNTAFLIWAATNRDLNDGRGTLFEASCSSIRHANTGIHLLINVLSTLLLAASNYCMQCLSAPSRDEIEGAHGCNEYLDIGISSLHNVFSRHVRSKKKVAWWILGISSFPLHLWSVNLLRSEYDC